MFRAAIRSSPRALRPLRQPALTSSPRRLLTTAPADKRHTWKNSAVRWGLAVAAVYWYNTSPIFADEVTPRTGPAPPQFSDSDLPTVDAVIEEKRKQADANARQSLKQSGTSSPPDDVASAVVAAPTTSPAPGPGAESAGALEEEAGQQGAFNPETGEINWDCPCLGGMAHGPCGEEFKTAFSCFVYSNEEPKGMDCIDKFQGMQDCFRKYPEIYGSELADEDEEADAPAPTIEGVSAAGSTDLPAVADRDQTPETAQSKVDAPQSSSEQPAAAAEQKRIAASEHNVPKKAFDATAANDKKKDESE